MSEYAIYYESENDFQDDIASIEDVLQICTEIATDVKEGEEVYESDFDEKIKVYRCIGECTIAEILRKDDNFLNLTKEG